MTTPNWSSTEATSFLWSPVDSDRVSRSWPLVIASWTAVFLRFAVVAISFVLPSLAATVDTASQVKEVPPKVKDCDYRSDQNQRREQFNQGSVRRSSSPRVWLARVNPQA